jgi:excinuclease ABC subunit A
MNQTVIPALRQIFGEQVDKVGKYESIDVPEVVRNVIVIDQDQSAARHAATPPPILSSSTKSAEYSQPPKKLKPRLQEGRFSFNVKGGRCETCQGDGVLRIEMNSSQMSMCSAANVRVNVTTKRLSQCSIRARTSLKCWI